MCGACSRRARVSTSGRSSSAIRCRVGGRCCALPPPHEIDDVAPAFQSYLATRHERTARVELASRQNTWGKQAEDTSPGLARLGGLELLAKPKPLISQESS